MEVITVESSLYKEIVEKIEDYKNIVEKINDIDKYIKSLIQPNIDEIWVDSYEVCTILKISDKTLQRLRNKGLVNYSIISKRTYYTIAEIKRLLDSKLIKVSDSEIALRNLVEHHRKYYEQRKAENTHQK